MEAVDTELMLADADQVARREEKVQKGVRAGDPDAKAEAAAPARPAITLAPHEVAAIGAIAKADALRKFLRGSPLAFR
jgi:ribosome-binding ATPase YchF (GTP1/OBG family)